MAAGGRRPTNSGFEDPKIRSGRRDPGSASPGGLASIINGIGNGGKAAMAIAFLIVAAVAVSTFTGGGGPGPVTTSRPSSSAGGGATSGSVATGAASATPDSTDTGGPVDGTGNLDVSGTEVQGSWVLDGLSGDVSPTDTLIASVWTATIDNVAEGYGDLIAISLGGPIAEGTQPTAAAGLTLGFTILRIDAAGADVFSHVFSSRAGECQVTMARTSTGVSGTFNCPSITDDDGHTVSATGAFAT